MHTDDKNRQGSVPSNCRQDAGLIGPRKAGDIGAELRSRAEQWNFV